ncbi:MAG: winged helix-turn-helix transcriptional regulator [Desulfocucumaceae bacterium]
MGGLRRETEGYIPKNGPANRSQRILAKEAIIELLKKGRHTTREIAEHFGISVEVVSELTDDLVKAGRVCRVPGKRPLVGLKSPLEIWCQGE